MSENNIYYLRICPDGDIYWWEETKVFILWTTVVYGDGTLDYREVDREYGSDSELSCRDNIDLVPHDIPLPKEIAKKIVLTKDKKDRIKVLIQAIRECKVKVDDLIEEFIGKASEIYKDLEPEIKQALVLNKLLCSDRNG